MRFFKFLLIVSVLSSCSKIVEGDAWSLKTSEIVSISDSDNLPDCGISYVLVEVQFKGRKDQTTTVYLPCVEVVKKPLPLTGDWCSAKGRFESINVGTSELTSDSATLERVTRELQCDGEKYVFDL